MTVGHVVLLGGAAPGIDPARLTARAREVLSQADVIVAPAGIEAVAPPRAMELDDLLAAAKAGKRVAWIREDAFSDDATRAALVRAEIVVELAWLVRGPLFGKRVLVTRAREQATETLALLRARGAEPWVVPAIEIHPPKDPERFARAVGDLGEAEVVVFTSANGVARTFEELARQRKDARAFGRAKVAAIGPGTAAALAARGIVADVVAKEFKQEGLAEAITHALPGAGGRALLLRAEVARDALPDALRAAGFAVEVVPAYETRSADRSHAATLALDLEAGRIDVVTFTSSSTVLSLCDMLGPGAPALLARTCVASIGPITTRTCEARGVRVDVTAAEYTLAGLLEALERRFS